MFFEVRRASPRVSLLFVVPLPALPNLFLSGVSMNTSIQSKVMLCSVTISSWVARRFDGKVTEEVEKTHHAKGLGRFNKRLLPEHAPSFAEVLSIGGRMRSYFYAHTLQYDQLGVRLLPTMI